jgi:glycosyltransferase involved in cell wall biosynthesis
MSAAGARPRVALIVPGFSAHERDWCIPALLVLVRELARSIDVHVYTLRYPGEARTYVIDRVPVVSLGAGEASGLSRIRLLVSAVRRVVGDARRQPFDVLHGLWADEAGAVAVHAARRLGIPAIVSLMGGELVRLDDIGYGAQRSLLSRILVRRALRQATVVTGGSAALCALARRQGAHRVERVPLGVDVSRFRPAPREDRARLCGAPALLHVASLTPVKNQALLLDAFSLVLHDLPRAHLHIVGGGPLADRLAAQARSLQIDAHTTFHGEAPYDDVPGFFQRADLFVLSSRYESQSMVALEAAACGLPIAGPRIGVLADLPEVEIAADSAPTALAHGVVRLWRDDRRRARADAARQRVESEYASGQTAARLATLYASVTTIESGAGVPATARAPERLS